MVYHYLSRVNVQIWLQWRWKCYGGSVAIQNKTTKTRSCLLKIRWAESWLRWFGHMRIKPIKAPMRQVDEVEEIFRGRERGRPKKTWWRMIVHDIGCNAFIEDMATVKDGWRSRIHIDLCSDGYNDFFFLHNLVSVVISFYCEFVVPERYSAISQSSNCCMRLIYSCTFYLASDSWISADTS